MSINVRTISQLPRITEINEKDLLEVSMYVQGKDNEYTSRGIEYSNLSSQTYNGINNEFALRYGLFNDCIVVLNNKIAELESYKSKLQNEITALQATCTSISNSRAPTFSSDKTLEGYVTPSSTTKWHDGTKYVMYFSNNGLKYSSEVDTKKSGQFICYGWLTGAASMSPAQCYVALEAYINSNWVMIQLQPWIVGANSKYTQYIGFNVPISSGLKLRVSTGFTISDFTQSYSGKGLVLNTESLNVSENTTNCFVGYII